MAEYDCANATFAKMVRLFRPAEDACNNEKPEQGFARNPTGGGASSGQNENTGNLNQHQKTTKKWPHPRRPLGSRPKERDKMEIAHAACCPHAGDPTYNQMLERRLIPQ